MNRRSYNIEGRVFLIDRDTGIKVNMCAKCYEDFHDADIRMNHALDKKIKDEQNNKGSKK
jgi:hypothetical protein